MVNISNLAVSFLLSLSASGQLASASFFVTPSTLCKPSSKVRTVFEVSGAIPGSYLDELGDGESSTPSYGAGQGKSSTGYFYKPSIPSSGKKPPGGFDLAAAGQTTNLSAGWSGAAAGGSVAATPPQPVTTGAAPSGGSSFGSISQASTGPAKSSSGYFYKPNITPKAGASAVTSGFAPSLSGGSAGQATTFTGLPKHDAGRVAAQAAPTQTMPTQTAPTQAAPTSASYLGSISKALSGPAKSSGGYMYKPNITPKAGAGAATSGYAPSLSGGVPAKQTTDWSAGQTMAAPAAAAVTTAPRVETTPTTTTQAAPTSGSYLGSISKALSGPAKSSGGYMYKPNITPKAGAGAATSGYAPSLSGGVPAKQTTDWSAGQSMAAPAAAVAAAPPRVETRPASTQAAPTSGSYLSSISKPSSGPAKSGGYMYKPNITPKAGIGAAPGAYNPGAARPTTDWSAGQTMAAAPAAAAAPPNVGTQPVSKQAAPTSGSYLSSISKPSSGPAKSSKGYFYKPSTTPTAGRGAAPGAYVPGAARPTTDWSAGQTMAAAPAASTPPAAPTPPRAETPPTTTQAAPTSGSYLGSISKSLSGPAKSSGGYMYKPNITPKAGASAVTSGFAPSLSGGVPAKQTTDRSAGQTMAAPVAAAAATTAPRVEAKPTTTTQATTAPRSATTTTQAAPTSGSYLGSISKSSGPAKSSKGYFYKPGVKPKASKSATPGGYLDNIAGASPAKQTTDVSAGQTKAATAVSGTPDAERLAREKADAERLAKEKAEVERSVREKAKAEKSAKDEEESTEGNFLESLFKSMEKMIGSALRTFNLDSDK